MTYIVTESEDMAGTPIWYVKRQRRAGDTGEIICLCWSNNKAAAIRAALEATLTPSLLAEALNSSDGVYRP